LVTRPVASVRPAKSRTSPTGGGCWRCWPGWWRQDGWSSAGARAPPTGGGRVEGPGTAGC